MCGIAAAVGPQAAAHQKTVGRLLDRMTHRGPDDRDLVVLDGCVLGANRLAVRDPGRCQQPRADDRGVAVVFNGELYNDLGTTSCDTERILELDRQHGPELAHHLQGMFAVALWDPARRQLRCLRDRFGEKPLYWATAGDGTVLVASEAQALARCGLISTELSRPSLLSYIRRSWVPPTHSIWEAINPLPPGHELIIGDDRVDVRRWWHPPTRPMPMDAEEASERLADALHDAVKRQVAACDRPIATLLSSGLDSTTVALLAAEEGVETAFGFGFDIDEDSEVPQARRSAEAMGLSFREVTNDLDPAEALLRVVDAMDEPLGDPSAIPTWYTSRAIAQEYPVVLGGDGADELLGGYLCWGRELVDRALETSGANRQPTRAKSLETSLRWLKARAGRTNSGDHVPERTFLDRWRGFRHYLTPDQAQSLDLACEEPLPSSSQIGADGTLDDVGRWDIATYLPGDILVKTDRMSMAHGLEMRSPFLDPAVSDLLLGMDWTNKVSATQEKVVLRHAFSARWPVGLGDRAKQGFGAPRDTWMESGPIRSLFSDTLAANNAAIYDHLPRAATQQLVDDGGQLAWSIGILALWLERDRE